MLTEAELIKAREVRTRARCLAARVKARSSGRMDPGDTPWHEAVSLANAADDAAWCIAWLVREVERLQAIERAEG